MTYNLKYKTILQHDLISHIYPRYELFLTFLDVGPHNTTWAAIKQESLANAKVGARQPCSSKTHFDVK